MSLYPGLDIEKTRFFVLFNAHASCVKDLSSNSIIRSPENEEEFQVLNQKFQENFRTEIQTYNVHAQGSFMASFISDVPGAIREVAFLVEEADYETLETTFNAMQEKGIISKWVEIDRKDSVIAPLLTAKIELH